MSEKLEELCVKHFLNWYNEQHKRNYIYQRAEDCFSKLKGGLRWEFVAYERDNQKEWIGIEVKELDILKEVTIRLHFWVKLCSELTKDLESGGIQGEFDIFPPVFELKHQEHPKFRKAFIEVLCQKSPNMKINEFTDIGPDIAKKFANWPKQKSNIKECDKCGEYRPSKLHIIKIVESGCEVKSVASPGIGGSVKDKIKEAFDKVFRVKRNGIPANEQLKLAKEKGARETILLLICQLPTDVVDFSIDPIKYQIQMLKRHLISNIDYISLVNVGSENKVVKIYPSE